jgi:hypothetical protein
MENKARLTELTLGGRTLAVDDLVEIWADDREPSIVKISKIKASDKTLEFDNDVATYASSKNPKLSLWPPKHSGYGNLPGPWDEEGIYLAYLDSWQHHVTTLSEPSLREVALGGPDTATRTKTISQVKLMNISDGEEDITCMSAMPAWKILTDDDRGMMNARINPGVAAEDKCESSSSGGYRRLENQLYRVEIHNGGVLDKTKKQIKGASFKWSRENGSVTCRIESIYNKTITVTESAADSLSRFSVKDSCELIDDERAQRGEPGILVMLTNVEGNIIKVDKWPGGIQPSMDDFQTAPVVRRWDSYRKKNNEYSIDIPLERDEWIELEDGLEVRFESGRYSTGDYWLIPARVNTEDIEWPRADSENPLPQPPYGITHHYAQLAILNFDGAEWTEVRDCRRLFSHLSDPQLVYVCGDGQEAMPGDPLPQALTVKVLNCNQPFAGARIRFTVFRGKGVISPPGDETSTKLTESVSADNKTFTIRTNADGEARCIWELPSKKNMKTPEKTLDLQQVEAVMIDSDDRELDTPVLFGASFSIAENVLYDSNPRIVAETEDEINTVEHALDELNKNYTIRYVSGDGQTLLPYITVVTEEATSVVKTENRLAKPLEVRVANGDWPSAGALVVFEIIDDNGNGLLTSDMETETLSPSKIIVETDGSGLASCYWKIDDDSPSQRAVAYVKDKSKMMVGFNAFLITAEEITYNGSDFPDDQHEELKVESVGEALDQLRVNYSLHYVSGDGQSTMPDILNEDGTVKTIRSELDQALEVRLSNGQWPVSGKEIVFEIVSGEGKLTGVASSGDTKVVSSGNKKVTITPEESDNGLVSCEWKLDGINTVQRVEAYMEHHSTLKIGFNAFLNEADEVSYGGSAFPDDQNGSLKVYNVEDALDQLRENYTLHYVGGDGQSAASSNVLPAPLQLRVANGRWPVREAEVTFKIVTGEGSITSEEIQVTGNDPVELEDSYKELTILTDDDGVAKCYWVLDDIEQAQQTEAYLTDQPNHKISFNAFLNTAKDIFYDGRSSTNLKETTDVQSAISELDKLAVIKQTGIKVTNVTLTEKDSNGDEVTLLNEMEILSDTFTKGITIKCNEEIAEESIVGKPACELKIEYPLSLKPVTPGDYKMMRLKTNLPLPAPDCYQPLILSTEAKVTNDGYDIQINLTPSAVELISNHIFSMIGDLRRRNRILTCLTLKGNSIWGRNKPDTFLDGEYFTNPEASSSASTGNFVRGGDFTIWFYIFKPIPPVTIAAPSGGTHPAIDVRLIVDDRSNTGIEATYFTADGSEPSIYSTRYTGPIELRTEGPTILTFFSIDNVGNIEGIKTETYSIDLTAPTPPTVSTTEPEPTNNKKPTWRWVSGGGGGNGTFRYRLENPNLDTGATETTTPSFTPSTDLEDDIHTLYVQERDDAGNWSSSGSRSIIIDTDPPEVSSTNPIDGATGVPI